SVLLSNLAMRRSLPRNGRNAYRERCTAPPVIPYREQEDIMRLRNFAAGTAILATLALAGCGTNPGDRAVSGGLLGAGAGAVVGAATGNPGAGAAIRGVAGAGGGAGAGPRFLGPGGSL